MSLIARMMPKTAKTEAFETSLPPLASDGKDFCEPVKTPNRSPPPRPSAAATPASPDCTPPAGRGAAADPAPTAAVLRTKLPAAAPCSCDGSVFWLDPYGSVHCVRCHPAPSAAIERGRVRVRLDDDGGFVWSHHAKTGPLPPDAGPLTFQADDERPCEKCGGKFFAWNIVGEKFCQKCEPERFAKMRRTMERAAKLREHYAHDPETVRRWERHLAKLAERAEQDAQMGAEWRGSQEAATAAAE